MARMLLLLVLFSSGCAHARYAWENSLTIDEDKPRFNTTFKITWGE